jgi:pyruvate/2-oxoglutarate dehydrogenase complex dihydrolipoamide dehydrogenase (E3) component
VNYEYDMTVIGGGAAGLTAAGMASVLGAKTALVSAAPLGGDCTWSGCIPSKSLIKAANVAHQMREAAKYGLIPAAPDHQWTRIIARVHAIRERIYEHADAPPNMAKLGVVVISAQAHFRDPHTIDLESGASITSRYFVIATGSTPLIPSIPGRDSIRILTNETLFELERRPQRLLIIGAGPVGIEMAQAFQHLGSQVTVVQRSQRILPRDDQQLAGILQDRLRDEGVRILLNSEIERIEPRLAYLQSGEAIEFDEVLAASGRQPALKALHLEAAGVASTEKGIHVDQHCRTTARNIFACGDVLGRHLFTHMAEHTAKVAILNALMHVPARVDFARIPWCTFTSPELAHVGATERDLQQKGVRFQIYKFPFSQLDRAITESEETGMIKILANRRGKLLGASILGSQAGEMIAEYALAMREGIGLSAISTTIHPYPTYALGNRLAADRFITQKLTPARVRWIQRLFRLHGHNPGSL